MSRASGPVLHLVAGPAIFLLLVLLPTGMEYPVRVAFGLLLWMAWWWVSGAVHLAVTGFLPLVVGALFAPMPVADLLPAYASQLIVLLIGANILAVLWTRWGLDRRIALVSLIGVGTDPRRQVMVWFLVGMMLSTVLPNTVVAAAMMPIVVAMLGFIGIEDLAKSRFATALGIAVAWGATVGGVATPLGGAPNLLAVGFIEDSLAGGEFLFITWVTRLLPITLTVMVASLIYMWFLFRPADDEKLEGTRTFFRRELSALGSMSTPERWALILFASATLLAFTRQLYIAWLPQLHPAYAFLTLGVLSFALRHKGEPLLTWEYAQKRMIWGLFYLFAGGAALGRMLSATGAAQFLADQLVPYASGGGLGAMAIFSLLAIVTTQITSNTAAVAILVPITIGTFQALGVNPIPVTYVVVAAANFGFILPSSGGGPAVAAGYGINLKTMFVRGLGLVALCWVLVLLVGYLLSVYWPGFSLV